MTSEQPPGAIIKTTARFQEAHEPLKQKPIIQIDPAAPLQQYENLARSSIDSGRDNPFRPDGKIYKSADPIVDYYKFGPHQSRAHSPTDSQLLVGKQFGDDDGHEDAGDEAKLRPSGKKWWRRKRADDKKKHPNLSTTTDDARPARSKVKDAKERPCWRRWFCCCCCCFERDDGSCCCSRRKKEEKFDTSQYESPPSVDAKTKDFKQSKIVVLQTGDDSDRSIISSHNSQQNGRNETSDRLVGGGGSLPDFDPNTEPKTLTKTTETMPILATDQKVAAKNQQQTRAKRPEQPNKSKRCVIT